MRTLRMRDWLMIAGYVCGAVFFLLWSIKGILDYVRPEGDD